MKKLLILFSFFLAFVEARSQVTPPVSTPAEPYDYILYRFRNYIEVSKGIFFPSRDTNWTPVKATIVENNGVWYGYIPSKGFWEPFNHTSSVSTENQLLLGGEVIHLGGFNFFVNEAVYRIDGHLYSSDTASFVLDSADADSSRIDKFYLATDQAAHVMKGEEAFGNALEPQLDGDQLSLAFVHIPAGATAALITTQKIYDENTESVVTDVGTTTDPDNVTNVYTGSKSLNVTNINNGDQVRFDGVWDITNAQNLKGWIKLKAVMPSAGNIRVQLFVGNTAVSSEVIIPIDKNNATTYQPFSIAKTLFGTITNQNITRVRLRYTRSGSSANYTGFYGDDLSFQTGITSTVPSTSVTSVGLAYTGDAFTITNSPVTGNGTLTVTPNGTADQYINGQGNKVAFPAIPSNVGPIDSRAKNADGLTIDNDSVFMQMADDTYPGLLSPALHAKISRNDSIKNIGDGDSLLVQVNDSLLAIKSIKFGTSWANTDTTIVIDTTASGGGPDTSHVTYITGSYTVQPTDRYIQLDGSGTITLPDADDFPGRIINIQSGPSGAIISPAYIIDGSSTTSTYLVGYGAGTFISDGTNWKKYIGSFTRYYVNPFDGSGEDLVGSTSIDFEGSATTAIIKNIKGGTGIGVSTVGSDIVIAATGGGGSGISEVVAGYGLNNVNDSTVQADSLVLVTQEKLYNVLDSVKADTANLLIESAGAGEPTWFASDDTLKLKTIESFYSKNDSTLKWRARVGSAVSSATPTINTDNVDIYKLTALAVDITSFTTNLSGSPNDGDILEIQITGTATRSITWGASFVSSTVTLPTATDGTNTLTVILQYYSTSSYGNDKWVCANYF